MYHTNEHLINANVDNSLHFNEDYYCDEDHSMFYDSHSSQVYDCHNISTNNEERKASKTPVQITTSDPDYEKQRPLFGWLPTEVIKKTYELTTQYARIPMSTILQKRYQSPNPAMNVHRRNEPVATDTIFSDTPAVDCGLNSAQFFVGCDTMVCDAYTMKSSKQFVNTLRKIYVIEAQ